MSATALAKTERDRAHDAVLDAFTEVTTHHDQPEDIPRHMGDILRNAGFEVIDENIIVSDDHTRITAWMFINGAWNKIDA